MIDWADIEAKKFLDSLDANELDDMSGSPSSPYNRLAALFRKVADDKEVEFVQRILRYTESKQPRKG